MQDVLYLIDQVANSGNIQVYSHFDTLINNLLSLENKYEMLLMQNIDNNRL